MTKIRFDRLKKLADHLERGVLGHPEFDFSKYNRSPYDENGCGAAGCAIGECPFVFPKYWKFDEWNDPVINGEVNVQYSGEKFFGLTNEEYSHLFLPLRQNPDKFGGHDLSSKSTRYEVAENIRDFIQNYQ